MIGGSLSRLLPSLVSEFRRCFGMPGQEAVIGWAPGRVNLIGEHTDYNGGYVLPMAIDRGIALLLEPTADRDITLFSQAYQEAASFPLEDISRHPTRWLNYPAGVARELRTSGIALRGAQGVVVSDLPIGCGLASSGALTVSSAFALLGLAGEDPLERLPPREIAELCQRAENNFVGIRCGIMDPFVSANAQAGAAMLLDCRDLSVEYRPLDTTHHGLVIADSGVTRELASSAYNARRQECEKAVAILSSRLPGISALRDVSPGDLCDHVRDLEPVLYRRARYVVEEIARTSDAAQAIREGDYAELGRLMNESHEGLRDLYEVSSPPLDRLVAAARSCNGTLGSRLTGAGFGGCTVSLVQEEAASELISALRASLACTTDTRPAVFLSTPAGGATLVRYADLPV